MASWFLTHPRRKTNDDSLQAVWVYHYLQRCESYYDPLQQVPATDLIPRITRIDADSILISLICVIGAWLLAAATGDVQSFSIFVQSHVTQRAYGLRSFVGWCSPPPTMPFLRVSWEASPVAVSSAPISCRAAPLGSGNDQTGVRLQPCMR